MIPNKEVPIPTPSIGKLAPLNRLVNAAGVESDVINVVSTHSTSLKSEVTRGTQVKYSVQLPFGTRGARP